MHALSRLVLLLAIASLPAYNRDGEPHGSPGHVASTFVEVSALMGYRYLKARGALNEVAPEPPALPPGPGADLAARFVPVEVIELVPESVARENLILPLAFDGETLTCAAVDPDNIALADKLRFLLNKNIRLVAAPREALIAAINYQYGRIETESVDSFLHEFSDAAGEEAQTSATASPRGAAPAARFKHDRRDGQEGDLN
jgi:Type II secretion system (T2SS), protein E, N-terminal domain